MNARQAIKISIEMGRFVGLGYLADLSDEDLFQRPCAGCNHINWQVGHLISAENHHINKAVTGSLPPLPAGFAEQYAKETAAIDDPAKFRKKAELLEIFAQQRALTLATLDKLTDDDLDKPSGMDFFPTVASLFELQGSHWLMHAGQWAVVRRQLGHKPLF